MTPPLASSWQPIRFAGERYGRCCPPTPCPGCPSCFSWSAGAVLRRWDRTGILTRAQIDQAIEALMGWPLRVTQVRGLFADAWRYEPTSPSPTPYTWRSPRTLAPTSYLMMADWPRPLAFQSYCTCQ